jgi:hypothetical protein
MKMRKNEESPLQTKETRERGMRVVLDRCSFSSLVFCAGGNNATMYGMLHVPMVRLHVTRVHVVARNLAHVHVRLRRTHVAVHFRRHSGHGNVRVVDIAFREVKAFFGLFQFVFGEIGAIGVCVMSATMLCEVVGAGEGLVAQGADVRAF